jgi:hypothetical protein
MWRAPDEQRVLLMAGRTTQYAVEPRALAAPSDRHA